MRHFKAIFFDVFTIFVAAVLALLLRDNLETSTARLFSLAPYFGLNIACSAILIPIFGINRSIWRFSALPDYLKLILAALAIMIGTVAATFAFNRLDGVPRSLPVIQFNLAITLLIGLRVFYRLHHNARRMRSAAMAPLRVVEQPMTETVLLVGLSRLAEAYLQCVAEISPRRVRVAGILANRERHIGRMVAAHRILGTPENIAAVLSDLDVSGVTIQKIVIAALPGGLSSAGRDAIAAIARIRGLEVLSLPATLGLEVSADRPEHSDLPISLRPARDPLAFQIQQGELDTMRQRSYWKAKRLLDLAGAITLLVMAAPLMIVAAACVAVSVGRPLIFWQERPGLGGRSFRLYKFRTMGPAYAPDGQRRSDAERSSKACNFLRRTRLDELPQLLNVLFGEMSFIGPRPLLPCDQDTSYRARLLVRPGLTGWAQVVGGRGISAEDKAALDIWYLKNANLFLDLKILIKTVPIVVLGETISRSSIEIAWKELKEAGVLRREMPNAIGNARVAA